MMTALKFSAALIILIGFGCRKGEEDPFFSLTSRKNRLCGEWKMTSYEKLSLVLSGTDTSSIWHSQGDGEHVTTYRRTWGFDEGTMDYYYSDYTLIINRDGSWEKTIAYDVNGVYTDSEASYTSSGHIRETESGTWSFLNKTDGYANKERVAFVIYETTIEKGEMAESIDNYDPSLSDYTGVTPAHTVANSYPNGDTYHVYDIIRLKAKTMKWEQVVGSHPDHIVSEHISWEAD